MLYTSPWPRFELTTSVAIGTDCICSCNSNYHTITATTASRKMSTNKPYLLLKLKRLILFYCHYIICTNPNYSAICFDLHSWVLVKLLSSQTHRTAERVPTWRIGRSPLDGGCQVIIYWLMFKVQRAVFQLYSGEEQVQLYIKII
jgi:hypothetical protein